MCVCVYVCIFIHVFVFSSYTPASKSYVKPCWKPIHSHISTSILRHKHTVNHLIPILILILVLVLPRHGPGDTQTHTQGAAHTPHWSVHPSLKTHCVSPRWGLLCPLCGLPLTHLPACSSATMADTHPRLHLMTRRCNAEASMDTDSDSSMGTDSCDGVDTHTLTHAQIAAVTAEISADTKHTSHAIMLPTPSSPSAQQISTLPPPYDSPSASPPPFSRRKFTKLTEEPATTEGMSDSVTRPNDITQQCPSQVQEDNDDSGMLFVEV